ncbi:membrane-spanning 4-domains subfamily A member 18 [Sorex araneus]|uniref:membrane-spanning 4-domains subfamily A member 18 n=1 Tax=Sorex araneus TaxID=42254 RepID=UPI0024337BE6|nr:membrane-spanning 4-domains subfamily A member 18 [Sorex araneus]
MVNTICVCPDEGPAVKGFYPLLLVLLFILREQVEYQLLGDNWVFQKLRLWSNEEVEEMPLNAVGEQRVGASRVPAVMDSQNIYLSHPGNHRTPGSQGQPLEPADYSNSREAQRLAGTIFTRTPPLPGQVPAGGRATHGQSPPSQHPAGPHAWPGTTQHTQGPGNTQPVPGYPPNPSGNTSNQFQWNLSFPSFSTFDFKKFTIEEAKTLGAIQILIGLMHIFSSINFWMYKYNLLGESGYMIWGGIAFVVSGSLSVYTEKDPNPCVVNVSVGANIVSAVCSLLGICIIITDMIYGTHHITSNISMSATLFPFSLLEFILSCELSYFGFQAVCWNQVWISSQGPGTAGAYPASAPTIPASVNTGPANVSSHQTRINNPPASFLYPTSTPPNVPSEPIYSSVADS